MEVNGFSRARHFCSVTNCARNWSSAFENLCVCISIIECSGVSVFLTSCEIYTYIFLSFKNVSRDHTIKEQSIFYKAHVSQNEIHRKILRQLHFLFNSGN